MESYALLNTFVYSVCLSPLLYAVLAVAERLEKEDSSNE